MAGKRVNQELRDSLQTEYEKPVKPQFRANASKKGKLGILSHPKLWNYWQM